MAPGPRGGKSDERVSWSPRAPAGVAGVPFHCLRHTAVSLLIAHEHLSPKQLRSVIGHASITLTYDPYGHLLPDSFEGFGAGLDAALAPRGDTAGGTAANLAIEGSSRFSRVPSASGAWAIAASSS